MKRLSSRVLLALSIAWSVTGAADTSDANFQVVPQPPRELQPLQLRIENDAGCFDGGDQAHLFRNGDEIAVHFFGVDHECPTSFRTPLFVSLGSFNRGSYTLIVRLCPAPPLECTEIDRQPLVVLPPPERFLVPALTKTGLMATLLLVLAAAVLGVRRR